jgi:hypothetical protein
MMICATCKGGGRGVAGEGKKETARRWLYARVDPAKMDSGPVDLPCIELRDLEMGGGTIKSFDEALPALAAYGEEKYPPR